MLATRFLKIIIIKRNFKYYRNISQQFTNMSNSISTTTLITNNNRENKSSNFPLDEHQIQMLMLATK